MEGKVNNHFLPSKENDPHRLCVACRGKSCKSDDHCEECDDRCNCVSEYMNKLSMQWEKKREQKAKASFSSSSFSGLSPSMPVTLCQLPSSVGSCVVTTTPPTSSECMVTVTAAAQIVSTAPFMPPADVTPVERSRKRRRVESVREREKMLAAFEDLWACGKFFSSHPGPSSASQPPLVTLPIAVAVPIPFAVPSTVSAHTSSSSHSTSSSTQLSERSQSSRWSGCRPVPAPASRDSRSCCPSGTQSRSQALSTTLYWASSSAGSLSERLWASSRHSSSSQDSSHSRLRARSPARVQASSLSIVAVSVESWSPLNSVPASYSTQTSYRRRSPSVASSSTHSPVLMSHRSPPRSCSRSHQSPVASVVLRTRVSFVGPGLLWGHVCFS